MEMEDTHLAIVCFSTSSASTSTSTSSLSLPPPSVSISVSFATGRTCWQFVCRVRQGKFTFVCLKSSSSPVQLGLAARSSTLSSLCPLPSTLPLLGHAWLRFCAFCGRQISRATACCTNQIMLTHKLYVSWPLPSALPCPPPPPRTAPTTHPVLLQYSCLNQLCILWSASPCISLSFSPLSLSLYLCLTLTLARGVLCCRLSHRVVVS